MHITEGGASQILVRESSRSQPENDLSPRESQKNNVINVTIFTIKAENGEWKIKLGDTAKKWVGSSFFVLYVLF